MRTHSNNIYHLVFCAGFFVALVGSGISLSVLSSKNKFFPGYNDDDAPSWVEPFYWLTTIFSLMSLVYVTYKIRQNSNNETDQEIKFYNLISINDSASDDGAESSPLIPKQNTCARKLGVGFFGSLSALALVLTFLFVARNDAQRSYEYSNSEVTFGLISAAAGIALLSIFTGILLCFCCRKKENNYSQYNEFFKSISNKEKNQNPNDLPTLLI